MTQHPSRTAIEKLCQQEGVELLSYIASPDAEYNHPFIPVAIVIQRQLPQRRCGEPLHNILKLHKIIWFDESYTYYFIEHESTANQNFLMPRTWDGGA